MLQLLQVRRADLDGPAAVPREPCADHARAHVDYPAAILVLRIVVRRDRVALFGLRKEEGGGDGERLLRIEFRGFGNRDAVLLLIAGGFHEIQRRMIGYVRFRQFQVRAGFRQRRQVGVEDLRLVFQRRLGHHHGAAVQPLRKGRRGSLGRLRHGGPDLRQPCGRFRPRRAVFRFGHHHHGGGIRRVIVHHALRGVAEERTERIEILLCDRVEFVIVTRRAAYGQAHECRADGLRAIFGIDFGVLVFDDARLVGAHAAADEARGNALVERRAGQQIARELFGGEAVIRNVAVVSLDHPVAIRPDLPIIIDVDTMRVAVPRHVQPVTRALLAIVRRGEIAIHHVFIGRGRLVFQIQIQFGGRGRQTGQIERHAANQSPPVGGRGGFQALRFQFGQNKTVNWTSHPRRVPHRRRRHGNGRLVDPLFFPLRAFLNPGLQLRHLGGRQAFVRRLRRHAPGRVCGADALEQQTFGRFAGYDHGAVRAGLEGRILPVQAQTGHAGSGIGPVALEAVVGE